MIEKEKASIVHLGNTETYTVVCELCGCVFTFEAYLNPGFSDHEDIYCPYCNEKLGDIRADNGISSFKIVKEGLKK